MIQQRTREQDKAHQKVKPLLRGWSHAIAALASIVLTVLLCWLSRGDIPRLLSMLIFGLSMIELYTVNILTGWVRFTLLVVVWLLALSGIGISIFALNIPRRVTAALYIGMGWVVVLALPAFLAILPWTAVATLILGGVLYTTGAIIYARKKPDPFPTVWGYHEVFHLFVIAGSVAFAACVWIWALPFPRM